VVVPEECVCDRARSPQGGAVRDQMKYGDVVPIDEVLEYLGALEPHGAVAG
jgi:hypothetical protein